jgi:ketosteroid isomerase-like protein
MRASWTSLPRERTAKRDRLCCRGRLATPITGREDPIDPSDPVGALAEFYRAFNTRDLALMERNWISSDEASMDNPLGRIKRGRSDISQVYERIFVGKVSTTVEFHDYTLHRFGETFLVVGCEQGTSTVGDTTFDLKIRTSRWFRLVDGRWRSSIITARSRTPTFSHATRRPCGRRSNRLQRNFNY